MSALITEAHRKLRETLEIRWMRATELEIEQLIADSEAAAVQTAMIREYGNLCATNEGLAKERDQLRAEVERLTAQRENLLSDPHQMNETPDKPTRHVIPNDEQCATAVRLYEAQGIYASDAAQILAERDRRVYGSVFEERDDLRKYLNTETDCAEAVEAAIVRQYARAERAEVEVERLTKQAVFDGDHIHTLNAAFATRAEVMDAIARAERAEAELATERARLDWLLSRMAGLVLPANKCVAWTVDVYDYQNRFPSRAAIDAAMKEGK